MRADAVIAFPTLTSFFIRVFCTNHNIWFPVFKCLLIALSTLQVLPFLSLGVSPTSSFSSPQSLLRRGQELPILWWVSGRNGREPDLVMNLKKRGSAKHSKTGHALRACFAAFSHLSASKSQSPAPQLPGALGTEGMTFLYSWFFYWSIIAFDVVLVSAAQWSESAMSIPTSPPSWTSLPPTTPTSRLSRSSQRTNLNALCLIAGSH